MFESFEFNEHQMIVQGLIAFGVFGLMIFLQWMVKNFKVKHVWTVHVTLGTLLGVLIISFLNLILETGTWRAFLIGDTDNFSWPFTIQNLMWLVFSITLLMLYAEGLFSKYDKSEDSLCLESLIDGRTEPVKFLIWMIPTIGFIGTVVGMSFGLSRLADTPDLNFSLENGLLQLVMSDLGTAFYTTILGLCMNILSVGLLSGLTYKHKQTLARRSN